MPRRLRGDTVTPHDEKRPWSKWGSNVHRPAAVAASAQHLPFRLAYITDTLGRPDAVAVAVTEHVATLDAPPPATTLLGMTRSTS